MDTGFSATRPGIYAVAGILAAMGAPAGFLVTRAARARTLPTRRWIAHEVSRSPLEYAYLLVATSVAFAGFGAVLGAREARRARLQHTRDLVRSELATEVGENLVRPLQLLLIESERLASQKAAGRGGTIEVAPAILRRVRDSAERVADLVDQIQDAALADEAPSLRAVSIRSILESVAMTSISSRLVLHLPQDLPPVFTDRFRLERALSYIVDLLTEIPGVSRVAVSAARDGGSVAIRIRPETTLPGDITGVAGTQLPRILLDRIGGELERKDGTFVVRVPMAAGRRRARARLQRLLRPASEQPAAPTSGV